MASTPPGIAARQPKEASLCTNTHRNHRAPHRRIVVVPVAGARRIGTPMLYEIINMSDPYTIECPSLEVAAVACFALGRGAFGFECKDDETKSVPIFLLGGAEQWVREKFDCAIEDLVNLVTNDKAAELADALDSCLIGDAHDRFEYNEAVKLIDDPEKREQFRARRHEDRRSSLNNIGARAYRIARNIREKFLKKGPNGTTE